MDRKIKNVTHRHSDKPEHQRWLYHMLDWGLGKAMLVVWLIVIEDGLKQQLTSKI
mgnify:CR=1 FL=1